MTRFRTETGSAPSGSEGIREDRERLRADNAALKQQLDVMRALASVSYTHLTLPTIRLV